MGAAQTILIVDDDVDFIATGRAALESAGYRVVAADDAESGFAAAMAERPGLILLDLMMEETDSGVRLAHQLRREPATKDIPIVILTGVRRATGFDFTPITREDYEWIGADAWVEKPVAPRALAGLAARVLEPRPDDGGEAS